jgi:7,8-dihydropterin-6-yl-methyl-4-(beta-D-ribofuranosyl)aminobenzene 5'-phosphate synthase
MKALVISAALLLFATGAPDMKAQGNRTHPQGELTVTILYDNFWTDDRLASGWGFAALLETPEHTVLFDTGADGPALLENMRLMGKDPLAVEKLVISHDHGDHTGGMPALFERGARPQILLLPGFSDELKRSAPADAEVVEVSPGQEIVPGIKTTGQMGTSIPEQALVLETAEGTVVLTGCAHPGIVPMVEKAHEISTGSLHLVMGGFHLNSASTGDIQAVLEDFRRLGVARAGPTHCSGLMAMRIFQSAYGDAFQRLGVGRVLVFPM